MRSSQHNQLKLWSVISLALVLLGPALSVQAADKNTSPRQAVVVIILDDIGNHLQTGIRVLQLPGKLNIGVLPHTPNSEILAKMAPAAGKEVILHAPMSNSLNKRLGPGALTSHMPEQSFYDSLNNSIASTPHVRGVSNHMGSELTQQGKQMAWLMQILNKHQLYFVDSRTSPHTVAAATAQAAGIPNLSRNVFLDNELNSEAIHERFEYALRLAQQQGLAVAIGHPHPETLAYLKAVIPELDQRGISLRYVSEVLSPQLTAANATVQTMPDQSRTSIPRSAM